MYHRDFSDRQQLSPSARADSYGAALFRLPILSNSQESFLVSWKPLKEVMVPLSCVSDLVCLGVDLFSQSVVTVNSRIRTETFVDGHLGQMKLKMEGVILVEPHATTFLYPKPQNLARVKFHEDSSEVIWLRL